LKVDNVCILGGLGASMDVQPEYSCTTERKDAWCLFMLDT